MAATPGTSESENEREVAAEPGAVAIEIASRSDVGCVRERNEDAILVADLSASRRGLYADVERHELGASGHLFVVCDGMGGAAAGDFASALAVDVVYAEMHGVRDALAAGDLVVAARLLRRAVRAANLRLFEEARKSLRRRGMGTTLSAALAHGRSLVLAQVGDSRAYLFRSSVLTQVTRDQSVVSALLNAGRLTPEEAKSFAGANVILQALGVADDVEVSLSLVELRAGDLLMVCSDGLHGPVGDEGLRELMATHEDLGHLAAALVARARAAGGPDNISLVLARFAGEALPPPASEEDLPRFVEFDPTEEGERAITSTSRVARRLAARAGMGDDTPMRILPPTGQHPALGDAEVERALRRARPRVTPTQPAGTVRPADAALAAGAKLPRWMILVALVAAVAVATLVLWKW